MPVPKMAVGEGVSLGGYKGSMGETSRSREGVRGIRQVMKVGESG